MDPTSVPAIRLTDLHKTFRTRAGRVEAVRGIDLTVTPGEVVALLGPNGAGKSTTLDVLLGFERPTSGRVELFGGDPADALAAGRVGMSMQSGGLLPHLTVGETMRLVASLFETPDRRIDVDDVARRAGVADLLRRRVGACSGGQQQRLRFALALLPDPDLLVLDEPTAGLDVVGRRDFWAAIRAEAQGGRTVVFATHYLAEADDMADRIVLMAGGRIVADGPTSQVKATALGRTVRCRLTADHDDALAARPDVLDVDRRGDVVVVRTTDSDALAHHLFATTDASDLEITPAGLEDAFVRLTTPETTR